MSDATRVWRSLIVDAKTGVSWDSWIRRTSRADDGRDPTRADGETKNTRRKQTADD